MDGTLSVVVIFTLIGLYVFYRLRFQRKDSYIDIHDALEASLDGLIVINEDGVVIEWNESAAHIFGFRKEDAIGCKLSDLIIPENLRQMHEKGMKRLKKSGKAKVMNKRLEMIGLHKSGSRLDIELIITEIKKNNRKFYLGFVRDLTEIKKSEYIYNEQKKISLFLENAQRKFIDEMPYQDRLALFDELLVGILEISKSEYGFIGEIFYKESGDPYLKTYAISNIAWNEETQDFYKKHAREGMEFHNLKTLFGSAMVTGHILISNNPSTDPRSGGIPKGHPDLNAFIGIPLGEPGKLIGMIGLANRQGGYDEAFVTSIKNIITSTESMIRAYRDFVRREMDILIIRDAENRLKAQNDKLENILEGTNVGTWEWHVQTGEVVFNERWANIIGYTLDELKPISIETWKKFCHPDDFTMSGQLLERHFCGITPYYSVDVRMRHKNGYWVWVHDHGKVAKWGDNGEPLIMFGTHTEITERKQAEEQAKFKANYDFLTELHSRHYIESKLPELLMKAGDENSLLALLFIDLDDFKPVNDEQGHEIGDQLLKAVAKRLQSNIRASDLVARIGGDEFLIVIYPIYAIDEIEKIAKAIIAAISKPFKISNLELTVSLSCGISIYPKDANDARTLMLEADQAMYEAKKSGKNHYCFYVK